MSNYIAVKNWRKRTKNLAIKSMGGKCALCGYNNCNEALAFHHLDPKEKDFSISKQILSWSKIVKELRKCILVCHNCHSEIHFNNLKIPTDVARFDESYVPKTIIRETICVVCEKTFDGIGKTCSKECLTRLKNKVDWNSLDLVKLRAEHGMLKLAKKLGVSYNTLNKRYKEQLRNYNKHPG